MLVLHLDVQNLARSVAPEATVLRVTVERVEVVMRPEILDGSGRLDVEQLILLSPVRVRRDISLTWPADMSPQVIGEFIVVPGEVLQVRYVISEASVLVSGIWEPVDVPSGERSGLKFVAQGDPAWFNIVDQQTTTVVATLDLGSRGQLHRNANGLQLRPTLPTHAVPYEMRSPFATDRVLVHYRPTTSQAERDALESAHGAELVLDAGDARLLRVSRRSPGELLELREALAARPELLTATVDPIWHVASATDPTDPAFEDDSQYHLYQVAAPAAWARTAGSQSVIVAVVDNGFDIEHPDLVDNLWVNPEELPRGDRPGCDGTPPFDFLGAFADLSDPADGVFTLRDLNRPRSLQDRDSALQLLRDATGIRLRSDLDGNVNGDFFSGRDLQLALANGCGDGDGGPDDIVDDLLGAGIFLIGDTLTQTGDPRAREGSADRFADPHFHAAAAGAAHGTGMASIIGAVGDNDAYITGVAQNVRLMLVNVSEDGGRTASPVSLHHGLKYAAKRGAHVINLSMVAEIENSDPDARTDASRAWRQVLNEALGTNPSVVLVAAAGNGVHVSPSGATIGFDLADEADFLLSLPAELSDPRMLAVTASERSKQGLLGSANYGLGKVHIVAPGEEIPVLRWGSYEGNIWDQVNGTSPATAVVSGAAALLVARCGASGAALKDALILGSQPEIPFASRVDSGRFLKIPGAMDAACP